MQKAFFRSCGGLLIACLFLGGSLQEVRAEKKPPNVVMILSDDQAWNDYSFMGHEVIETPHLDRLAENSLTYTRGYVPVSLCRPSLATMITGLYPHQHRITGNDPVSPNQGKNKRKDRLSPAYQEKAEELISQIDPLTTLPEFLKAKGYASLQTGKWWEGNPSRGGFDEGMTHGDPKRGGRHGDLGLKIGREGMKPIYDFVAKNKENPFFIWYAPFLPHTPHNPPERWLSKYRSPDRPIELARYYAMVSWFDETCGELLDHLEEEGLAENTLVVYVTDNGWIQKTPQSELPDGWNQPFAPRSKRSPQDGGIRTPIMFSWPGTIEPKMDETTLVSSIDLVPSVLAACGIEIPQDLPGLDVLDPEADAVKNRHRLFGEIFDHDVKSVEEPWKTLQYRWVIDGEFKLILPYSPNRGGEEVELYHITEDPFEEENIASQLPQVVETLTQLIDHWWSVPGQ
ncbi:Choline-sulfatase [Planctomycetales bacterium 10988]|nr:Choline-sulfatase [Planctomycetales bacterium 10988]